MFLCIQQLAELQQEIERLRMENDELRHFMKTAEELQAELQDLQQKNEHTQALYEQIRYELHAVHKNILLTFLLWF